MEMEIKNFICGKWTESSSKEFLEVNDPATLEILGKVPVGTKEDVDAAVTSALQAFESWRNTPAESRIQFLFRLKTLIEDNADELARICSMENGKTISESKGEITRAIENIETACGIPILMQGAFSEDIAQGIDEFMVRQPVGVCACIAPFNFPVMIAFWFMPYAIACGNTFIVKPSEKVPLSLNKIFELIKQTGIPDGVVNLVNGNKGVVDAILDHPGIRAISFVGSTPVAKYIYSRGTLNGKRVQAQGGAKNSIVVMPDCDPDLTAKIIVDSAFGCAGQRCLAASNLILCGGEKAGNEFAERILEMSRTRVVGYGLEDKVEMGPVISSESKVRIEGLIEKGVKEGAKLVVDGRGVRIKSYENGFFLKPTVLFDINPAGELFNTEIFGPVLGIINVPILERGIEIINSSKYGNAASIFTNDGRAARRFRHDVNVGNIGVNIGIAAPMASFPFSGWKDSFFGDLHGQSHHAVEFFTQTKVVVERWPKEWSRKF